MSRDGDEGERAATNRRGGLRSLLLRLRDALAPGYRTRRQARKLLRREARFSSALWQRKDGMARRDYPTYQDYLSHQADKLDRIRLRRHRKEPLALQDFRRRFADCEPLREAHSVLCLGARLGAEVQALRNLGHFAIGVDLNPGPRNAYVCHGDFHDLKFASQSVDAVYTNAIDHVYDLSRVVREIHRVLRPRGIFILDMLPGYEEGFVPGAYESSYWQCSADLMAAIVASAPLELGASRELGGYGANRWRQVVFRQR